MGKIEKYKERDLDQVFLENKIMHDVNSIFFILFMFVKKVRQLLIISEHIRQVYTIILS